MNGSPAFIELEALIERDWHVTSLYQIIQMLEEAINNEQIDTAERDALIQLYMERNTQRVF